MQSLIENRVEILNTVKLLIYKENRDLFNYLNFDDENTFFEPLLFAYFHSTKSRTFSAELLPEIIQGYFNIKKEVNIKYSYNKNNIAYIPKIGYFQKNKKLEDILFIGELEIVKEIHPLIEKYFVHSYRGHIINPNPVYNSVWKDNHQELAKSILVIKSFLPNFYKEFVFANKKIYLHDNTQILNFTTIETLGMLYFYVLGKKNIIYFIEELIHQGSHNFLYYKMHSIKDFFKIDPENTIMRDLTGKEWDYRDVFGAFHGLYTVTRRVECFDLLLSNNVFSGREKHELLGRFADQFNRFRTGLELLNLEEVYTPKGGMFYQELDLRCMTILNKYIKLPSYFNLSNRDLDFRYVDFCLLNPYDEFLNKESEGFFNFN